MASGDDFKSLSDGELAEAYAGNILARAATEHVGRINRLFGNCDAIVRELKARSTARPVLEELSKHRDPDVRASAQSRLQYIDYKGGTAEPERPYRPPPWQYMWQCDNPAPPPAMTREAIVQRLRRVLPEHCDRLVSLMRPAFGLWPRRWRGGVGATASRFGGMPIAPAGWQWPTVEDEPLLFVGQINCSELAGLPGAELLPRSGLLVFFGDHDAVQACRMEALDDTAVFHWTDVERLVPAIAPIEPIQVFPQCALTFRALVDLPDPFSRAVQSLRLNEEEDMLYAAEWREIRRHRLPEGVDFYASFSKLLGWPALVQWHDLDVTVDADPDDLQLLLQVDEYCNGEEVLSFGPGGSLYFLLSGEDLRAGDFANCTFDIQFT
jgi:uncharacterized protein YwqG